MKGGPEVVLIFLGGERKLPGATENLGIPRYRWHSRQRKEYLLCNSATNGNLYFHHWLFFL